MSKHTYPWYAIPGRLAKALVGVPWLFIRDWLLRRTCKRCKWFAVRGYKIGHCSRHEDFVSIYDACDEWEEYLPNEHAV
jgi:hypothetical protein